MPYYTRDKRMFLKRVTDRFVKAMDQAIKAGIVENDKDLAERISVDRERLSEYRNGKKNVTLYTIYRLCELTGVSTDVIIRGNRSRKALT